MRAPCRKQGGEREKHVPHVWDEDSERASVRYAKPFICNHRRSETERESTALHHIV